MTSVDDDVELIPRENPTKWKRVTKILRGIFKNEYGINAEPLVFTCAIVYGILITVAPIFWFWARCVEIFGGFYDKHNATKFCAQISIRKERIHLNTVQNDISEMAFYNQLCGTVTSLIGSAIVGVWSDYNGRRKPLILSMAAFTIYIGISTLAIFIYDRVNIYYLLFIGEFFMGCLGGVAMPAVITSTMIIDDSRKDLTISGIPWRVALSSIGRTVGNILGSAIYTLCAVPISESSDNHIKGIFVTYLIAFACCLISLVFAVFCVRETHNALDYNGGSRKLLENVMHYSLDTFRVFTRRREGWTRMCLCLVTSFMFVDFISLDSFLVYSIFKQPPFRWTDELFGNYITFKNVITAAGVTVLPMLISFLHCAGKESIMLIVALFTNSISTFIISIAKSTELIFIAVPLYFLGSGTIPGFQTVLSKMVVKEETARMFAFFSMLLVISPLFSKALLYLYNLTLTTYPSFVFVLLAIIIFITFIGQIVVHVIMRKKWTEDTSQAASMDLENDQADISVIAVDAGNNTNERIN